MPLLARVSAVPLSLSMSPVGREVPVSPPPPVCPSGHQALRSGIGPFFERSIDNVRRPSALIADASPACRSFGLTLAIGRPRSSTPHTRLTTDNPSVESTEGVSQNVSPG